MKIKILSSAYQDLINGYLFYEKQGETLGVYFLDSLYSDIDSLTIYGGIHPVYFNKYHRALSKRFPFSIYYKMLENSVIVYAVLDCRHDPAWIRSKLE